MSLGNYIDIDADGGDHRNIYSKDGECLVTNPLGESLDPKLRVARAPIAPPTIALIST